MSAKSRIAGGLPKLVEKLWGAGDRRDGETGRECAPAGQTAHFRGAVSAAKPPAPAQPERPAGADPAGFMKMGKERL